MHETFRKMKSELCDAITFLPSTETEGETVIQGLTYKEKGETIGSSSIGDLFDIILFREGPDEYYDNEQFQAILVCPYTYSEKIMRDGHFGMIARKTTTSNTVVEPFRTSINTLLGNPV